MAELRERQLAVLSSVHAFFLKVISRSLNHDVPLPAGVLPAIDTPGALEVLEKWLDVLDLAMSPQMFRDEMANASMETATALLKFYTQHPAEIGHHRDKTDFVVTWLYRHSGQEGDFEQRLNEIIGKQPPLPGEYRQLLREFRFLKEEADDVLHFDKLMDSGLIERVRDVKASFGSSFYHSAVLATVAAYNVGFGKRFDELFKEATRQIRVFAQSVQQEGGNISARVEGDVTVKQLGDISDQQILATDYREAQEQFRRVSKIKKAVDSKRKRTVGSGMAASAEAAEVKAPVRAPVVMDGVVEDDRLALIVPNESPMAAQMEESKLTLLADQIRSFVKAADPASAQIVPLKHGNLVIGPHEAEAFRVDYSQEKSFRADFASVIMKLVGCRARIDAEIADYRKTEASAYLWKPHADSLANLVRGSQKLAVEANQVKATATQRGLSAKADAVANSLQKLQDGVRLATKTLSQLGAK